MEIVYVDETPSLAHHGIKGQKWGVRRFQNYDGSYTADGRARYLVGNSVAVSTTTTPSEENYDHSTNKSTLASESLGMVGLLAASGAYVGMRVLGPEGAVGGLALGSAMGLIVAGGMAVSNVLAGKHERKILEGNKESGVIDPKTGFYKKADREYTEEEDIKAVNPGYKKYTDDTKNNCLLCTLTYNLRQDGYAVSANYASRGFETKDLKRWFKNPKITEHEEAFNAFNPNLTHLDKKFKAAQTEMLERTRTELEAEGPGARGYLSTGYYVPGQYDIGVSAFGGHAMAYKVNAEGKVDIIDAQDGKIYKDAFNNMNKCRILQYSLTMDHARLDNVEINTDTIQEVAHS